MRYRVETHWGSASFDAAEFQKAMVLFHQEGIRLFRCRDLFDEGVLLEGPPVYQDLTREGGN